MVQVSWHTPSGMPTSPLLLSTKKKRTRTRAGCWNCKKKRKKCDENQPICANCAAKGEVCEWGVKLSFRSENVQSLSSDHPSMRQFPRKSTANKFEIFDVSHEVIRDYWNEIHMVENAENSSVDENSISNEPTNPSFLVQDEATNIPTPIPVWNFESPVSITQSAASQLLELSRAESINHLLTSPGSGFASSPSDHLMYDDGIFLPGSAYLELHSTLRSHMFDTARSAAPTRGCSPEPDITPGLSQSILEEPSESTDNITTSPLKSSEIVGSKASKLLTQQEEYILWKNWTDEIAPWLDKFDNECHFQRAVPLLAKEKENSHLCLSILAVSARQQERKNCMPSTAGSLALYQEAIQNLIPELDTKSTAVVASCVILCVLEMMSCSPKMWRRHLEGCAMLIQSLGFNGFSGGMEQAIFWCFIRMDLCGGLISSEPTLIPVEKWTPIPSLAHSVQMFQNAKGFDMYANFSVFLCANVRKLLSKKTQIAPQEWKELFAYVEDWYVKRPAELRPISEFNAPDGDYSRPFPMVLYSNAPAISGTQLYHAAAILMLQNRPHGANVSKRCRSILWHARRVCAISISNTHHGAWTNSIQPLWIAGKIMSHPAEHRAILDIYDRIQRETGWGTDWRSDDLKNYWGELDST